MDLGANQLCLTLEAACITETIWDQQGSACIQLDCCGYTKPEQAGSPSWACIWLLVLDSCCAESNVGVNTNKKAAWVT